MRPIKILGLTVPSGGSGSLDTQTITVGTNGSRPGNDRTYGYNSSASFGNAYVIGSIVDGTSNLYSGASIITLDWAEGTGYEMVISGTLSNSGWTSVTIGGAITLTRATATFLHVGGNTVWTWNQSTAGGQAFGTSGTKTIGFN